MSGNNIRQAEEALYMHKYLFGRIAELEIHVNAMLPTMPGSVLKMVGRPVAKTPMDTSETEQWGIIRATCEEAIEMDAKGKLKRKLDKFKSKLPDRERALVHELYDREQRPIRVRQNVGLTEREYHTMRQRILRKLCAQLQDVEDVFEIAVK